jgi:hypothetical protein
MDMVWPVMEALPSALYPDCHLRPAEPFSAGPMDIQPRQDSNTSSLPVYSTDN